MRQHTHVLADARVQNIYSNDENIRRVLGINRVIFIIRRDYVRFLANGYNHRDVLIFINNKIDNRHSKYVI